MAARIRLLASVLGLFVIVATGACAGRPSRPNIIFILSDDLAQGDVGCYGQKLIQTPNLDRMAREGIRFTQAYCGTAVCAPSRTSLMTGLHTGHGPVRANWEIAAGEGQLPLPASTVTVAEILKRSGYRTACVGKWGMGMFHTTGSPLRKGFDHFFGYNCQRHAHSYFPTYLYRDGERFPLEGNDGKGIGQTYAQELIQQNVERWIRESHAGPFFLFYAITLPHGRHEIDNWGRYANENWTAQQKSYAAQVSRLDSDIGRLLALLRELKIDEKTLVMTAGDNGSSFGEDSEIGRLFNQSMGGKLRGFKRSLYEGGLRQAALARWPGVVAPNQVRDEPWAFWDFLPTAAELAGAPPPNGFQPDGKSLVAFLQGGSAPTRDHFYWELHEGPFLQAVRFGKWKAVRNGVGKPIELYDLEKDPGERNNLASKVPAQVQRAEELMKTARTDDPNWPIFENAKQRGAWRKTHSLKDRILN